MSHQVPQPQRFTTNPSNVSFNYGGQGSQVKQNRTTYQPPLQQPKIVNQQPMIISDNRASFTFGNDSKIRQPSVVSGTFNNNFSVNPNQPQFQQQNNVNSNLQTSGLRGGHITSSNYLPSNKFQNFQQSPQQPQMLRQSQQTQHQPIQQNIQQNTQKNQVPTNEDKQNNVQYNTIPTAK